MKKMSALIIVLFVALVATALRKTSNTPAEKALEVSTAEVSKTSSETMSPKTESALSSPTKLHQGKALPISNVAIKIDPFFREAFNQLPTTSDLKDTNGDGFHHRPEAIQNAADLMGKVAEHLEKNPTQIKQAIRFYENCAQREQILFSVRALCLRNFMDHTSGAKPELSRYSPELVRVANKIPSK